MICHVCGGTMQPTTSDLPLKIPGNRIVIFKSVPVHQCDQCGEYMVDHPVMVRLDELLERVDPTAELEIVRFAA